ncbi:hypothetical protein [Rhodohalobacter sp. SW132]|uniref:hypothetical protein n=2 Tax=Rhodohalobacter sp. SW132 TaxID=2293433 RepID=UPI000E245872|nr:hypothetical protein [Rhodohalobacter sp. SW132]
MDMEEDILNSLNEELEDVIDEGRQIIENAELKDRFNEVKTDTELFIRKHPIQSVLLGAAAGYLIGKIFRS